MSTDSDERPLVTILLLTYRHEKFLGEAIRGVLAQTYSALEIIILDDASPDATPKVIASELERHPRGSEVRVIRNPSNLGFRDNTVRGLSEAHGDFIVRLAGDDIAAPGLVERLVAVWRAEDVSLITVNATIIDRDSKPLGRFHRNPAGPHDTSLATLARDGVNDLCFGAVIAFARELYEEFGWSPAYLQASDIMMPFYAYLAKGARFIAEPLVQYRAHGGNMSLSVAYEHSVTAIDKALVEEQMQYLHLAHAVLMDQEIDRLRGADPVRFAAVARDIRPLLAIQRAERACKLVAARIALHDLGVKRLAAPVDLPRKPWRSRLVAPLWRRLSRGTRRGCPSARAAGSPPRPTPPIAGRR